MWMRLMAVAGCALATMSGCESAKRASEEPTHEERIAAQIAAKKSPMGTMDRLIGVWEQADEQGQMHTVVSYRATANGTAVCETLFEGTPHEMITMYHMDGDSLMMTHYCAAGNQPRLRQVKTADPNVLRFEYAGATNYSKGDVVMGRLVMTFADDDHLTQAWTSFDDGKEAEGVTFTLTRKTQ